MAHPPPSSSLLASRKPRSPRLPTILVIGSINMDLTTLVPRFPRAGETLTGRSLTLSPGGKGANQAVACARASRTKCGGAEEAEVRFVCAVGAPPEDVYAGALLREVRANGVVVHERVVQGVASGTASVMVEERGGENCIAVVPGANGRLTAEMCFPAAGGAAAGGLRNVWEGVDVLVVQLEIPMAAVVGVVQGARARGVRTVVVNAAPCPARGTADMAVFKREVLGLRGGGVHLLVNEEEGSMLSGVDWPARGAGEEETAAALRRMGAAFADMGVEASVVTLGGKGAYAWVSVAEEEEGERGAAAAGRAMRCTGEGEVTVVDTTGAGDTFVGAYAVCLAKIAPGTEGQGRGAVASMVDYALGVANAAARKSVQKRGAMQGMPWMDEVEQTKYSYPPAEGSGNHK
jgi:ribokinase